MEAGFWVETPSENNLFFYFTCEINATKKKIEWYEFLFIHIFNNN